MRILASLAIFCIVLCAHPQSGQAITCLSDELRAAALAEDTSMAQRLQQMEVLIAMAPYLDSRHRGGNLTIPVVVHIIHDNDVENISDATAMHGVEQLNEAFANEGPYLSADGTTTEIRFCLAVRDPEGLATTGIEHIQSSMTDLLVEAQDEQMKALSHWDPYSYLNIYVVREITSTVVGSGAAGYAYLPAFHGTAIDGVVVEYPFFGGDDHFAKVTVHEVGHYLGLLHTFDGGCANNDCLSQGDRVCDTAPDGSTASSPCQLVPNTCSTDEDDSSLNNPFRAIALGGLGDQPDPFRNYLDYGELGCKDHFTPGQSDRMFAALTTSRASLLDSEGCTSPCIIPFEVIFTTAPSGTVAPNQPVTFTSTAMGASILDWSADGLPLGSGPSATTSFSAEGAHVVQLTGMSADGYCIAAATDTIIVDCPGTASFSISATQVLPGDTIELNNTSTGVTGLTWHLDGQPIGSAVDTFLVITTSGSFTLFLASSGPDCPNTSTTVFIQVGNCTDYSSDMHWYFGDSAAIHFNNGAPTPLADSPMWAREGTSAWSDRNGDLVFYSNGRTVYNRLHLPMPNGTGLLGGPLTSSINQTLIVPMPGDTTRFYVIAIDEFENDYANGVTWSIVDMDLDNGHGDVVLMNQPLIYTGGETMGACYHANGQDAWLAIPVVDPPCSIRIFRVTSTGIEPWAVEQLPGALHVTRTYFSNSGKRLVCSLRQSPNTWHIRLYDFDPASGALSNAISWPSVQNTIAMTMEFSPSDRFLYFSRMIGVDQYDLSQTTATGIQSSVITVYSNTFPTALRLAPDQRIYGEWAPLSSLPVIQFPDVLGTGCGYLPIGPSIAPGQGVAGLPTFIKGKRFRTSVQLLGADTACRGAMAVVHAQAFDPACTYAWWIGGQPATAASPGTLEVPDTGADSVQVMVTKTCDCGGISGSTWVHFVDAPDLSLGADTTICAGDSLTLDAGAGFTDYSWSNGSSQQTTSVDSEGDAWVEARIGECASHDTIHLELVQPAPPFDLGPDTTSCTGAVVVLDAGGGYTSYAWQDGWPEQTYTAWLPGIYWVTAYSPCGDASDTIQVMLNDPVPLDLGPDRAICAGSTLELSAAPAINVNWSTGETTSTIVIDSPGMYWAEIPQPDGCTARDTVEVSLQVCDDADCDGHELHWFHLPDDGGSWLTITCPFQEGIGRVFDARGRLVRDNIILFQGQQWITHTDWSAAAYVLLARIDGVDHELKFVLGRN